jgi:AcrR family transcriptional regulator
MCYQVCVIVGNVVDEEKADRTVATSEKMLHAAAELLRTGGVEALSTRAVAAAAGVQPPTIYRQFGNKEGLLDAVAHFALRRYMHAKRRILNTSGDPVDLLRQLWDLNVDFGLKNPDAYMLAYADPRPGKTAAAAEETTAMLKEAITRIAEQGRLCMGVERATKLLQAAGVGMVITTLAVPPRDRDDRLFVILRENTLRAILTDNRARPAKPPKLPALAVALAEAVRGADATALTPAERALLTEWLDRLVDSGESPAREQTATSRTRNPHRSAARRNTSIGPLVARQRPHCDARVD